MNLLSRVSAELFGTAFLLAIVVGSGIMAERLAGGNEALALLANSLATGAGLLALINTLAPISGAHFNPLVSVMMTLRGDLNWRACCAYVPAQFAGAILGVFAAHAMFALPLLQWAEKSRSGVHLLFSEFVATLGLLCIILIGARRQPEKVAASVAAYITAAYWFTSSTSFANPAVTLARAMTDTFCGIQLSGVPAFWLGQILALALVLLLSRRAAHTR